MYYEDKAYKFELSNKIQEKVNDFFHKEFNRTDSPQDQLITISTYNILQLSWVNRKSIFNVSDFKIAANQSIKHFFNTANEHDLFAVRLDQLSAYLTIVFGKEFIDELKEDLIKLIIETKPTLRFSPELNNEEVVVKKTAKEIQAAGKMYEEFINEIFNIYPSLWLIPYLNEAFVKRVG